MKTLTNLIIVSAGLLIAAAGFPAQAQDEDDRLIARDGDLLIYRMEDGKVKITREGTDEEKWVVVVDPERRGRTVMLEKDVDRRLEFLGQTPHVPLIDMEWEDGRLGHLDRENIIIRMGEAGELADKIRQEYEIQGGPLGLIQERSALRREVAEKEAESARLAREWRKAEGAEKTRLEAELDSVLDELFEAKEQDRREELSRLQEREKDLESRVAERQRRKAEIIARRKSRLLGENDPLAW